LRSLVAFTTPHSNPAMTGSKLGLAINRPDVLLPKRDDLRSSCLRASGAQPERSWCASALLSKAPIPR
jgi:hypothetical protein